MAISNLSSIAYSLSVCRSMVSKSPSGQSQSDCWLVFCVQSVLGEIREEERDGLVLAGDAEASIARTWKALLGVTKLTPGSSRFADRVCPGVTLP